jgi:hypothetical protein
MTNSSINFQNSEFEGNLIQGNVTGNVTFTKADNSQNIEIAELAKKLQDILESLEADHSSNTISERMKIATEAISIVEKDLPLRRRILSAVKTGGISAFEQLLNHPAASFVMAAINDWQQTS